MYHNSKSKNYLIYFLTFEFNLKIVKMKKLLFLIFFVSGVMTAQTYKVGIVGDYSYATKIEGSIIITDSIYTLTFKDKAPIIYDVLANKNGVVYITDGVMTD